MEAAAIQESNPYQDLAQTMLRSAPAGWQRLRAQLRMHGSMFTGRYFATLADGPEQRFELPLRDNTAMQKAAGGIDRQLATSQGAGLVRADFSVDTSGRFKLDVHHQPRLLQSLADALRHHWPAGVQKLRLSATYNEHGRFEDRYERLDGGIASAIEAPAPGGDFDDTRKLLADLWFDRAEKFQELRLECGSEGGFELRLDGRPGA